LTTFTSYDYDSDNWGQEPLFTKSSLRFPSHGISTGPRLRAVSTDDDQVQALFSLSKVVHSRVIGPFSVDLIATHRRTREKQIVDTVHVFNRAEPTCTRCKANPLDISFGVRPFSTEFEYSVEFATIQGSKLNPLGLGFPKLEIKIVDCQ
jgi:hypothetical protein